MNESLKVMDGQVLEMEYMLQVDGEMTVRLDFILPLAGKENHFAIKITGLRPSMQDALGHGRAHSLQAY